MGLSAEEQDGYSEACCLRGRKTELSSQGIQPELTPLKPFHPTTAPPMVCLFKRTIRVFAHERQVVPRPYPVPLYSL